ncbi:hypothetical protein ACTQ3T_10630 [Segatella copri]|uniref:hypothetical protein n=1 Tax=Segatella copri TaxID=165179 RepID=UPI003F96F89C
MKTKFSTCASRAHLQHHIRCIGLKSPIPITLQTTSWLLGDNISPEHKVVRTFISGGL